MISIFDQKVHSKAGWALCRTKKSHFGLSSGLSFVVGADFISGQFTKPEILAEALEAIEDVEAALGRKGSEPVSLFEAALLCEDDLKAALVEFQA